jgi:hypothetical protein
MNRLKFPTLLSILIIVPLQNAIGAGGSDLGGSPNTPLDTIDIKFYYQDLLLLAQKIKIYARQYHLLSEARISIKRIFLQTYLPFQLTSQARSYAATIKSTLELELLGRQQVQSDVSAYISENIKQHTDVFTDNLDRISNIQKAIEDNILEALGRTLNFIRGSIEESNYPTITSRFKDSIVDKNDSSTPTHDTQLVKLFLEIFPSALNYDLPKTLQEILNEDDDSISEEYDDLSIDPTFNTHDGWEKALFAFLSPEEIGKNIVIIDKKVREGTLISDIFYMMSPEFELELQNK